jgi:hypothetical protein
VISAVQLQGIRLVEADVKTKIRSAKDAGPLEISYAWVAHATDHGKNGTFRVHPIMEVRVSPRGSKAQPAVVVKVGFELTYSLPKSFSATQQELEAFAQTNGVFNAWPYWREFVQNMFARMNLPQPALPLYRLSDAKAPRTQTPAKDASKGD